jgi:tetratricopeptide (TPR) repeat protein
MTHRNHPPLSPAEFTARFEEARRAHVAKDFKRAHQLYESLVSLSPGETGPQVMLADLDLRAGRLLTARRRLEPVVAAHPESEQFRNALARILEELGDANAAEALYREDVARAPDTVTAWARLAHALQVAGKIDEAAELYRKMIDRWPDSVAGYFGLAGIEPKSLSDAEMAALQRLSVSAPLNERVYAFFALGTLLESRDSYDDAFAAFSEGNRLRRENPDLMPQATPVDQELPTPRTFTSVDAAEQMHENFAQETKRNFSAAYIEKFQGRGESSRAPIFIVGLPRSGSTLLEQILSSHPQVQGLGETFALSRTFQAALAELHAGQRTDPWTFYRDVGASYLEALAELGWDRRSRAIDKMLGNYVNVGIIHLALPNAVIIHAMRNPVDTCLSAFRQLFGNRNEVTYDLAALGRQYVRYRGMMAHWDAVLPGKVLHVEHERLLAEPEAQVRALLKACDLPWDDRCLRFYENERTVRTASINQVRRPLSDKAVERWRKYEKHLGPLFDSLGPYAPARS